jgi:hypothetical protein
MKGFLERLIRTAGNPAESVRPWTASVFAGRHQGDFQVGPSGELAPPTPALGSGEETSDSAQVRISKAPLPSDVEHSSTISGSPPTEIAQGGAGPGQCQNRRSPAKSLMPPPLIVDAVWPTHAAEVTQPEPARAKASPNKLAHPGNERFAAKPGRAKVEFPIGSSLPPYAGKRDAPATHSLAAANQQAEEIQIHIGRIEVIAVHPPAPRTGKAPEKEISLDAYLKRRGGRAG